MKKTEHSLFILSPIFDILTDALFATKNINYYMESYPVSEYLFQSIFLKMTGCLEQKCKCICWDISTFNYDLRRNFLREMANDTFSNYDSKNYTYKFLLSEIDYLEIKNPLSIDYKKKKINEIQEEFKKISRKFDFFYLNDKVYFDFEKMKNTFKAWQFATDDNFFTRKDIFDLMIEHRNRCAHNTSSYQLNLPSINKMQSETYKYKNYVLFFYLITVFDTFFMDLYKCILEAAIL